MYDLSIELNVNSEHTKNYEVISMKRTLTQKAALISALAMLATTMTACGGGTAEETTVETTTATMKEEQAAVVEQVEIEDEKLENGTLRWLSFWDINPTEGKPVPVSLQLFQTKYGGTVEYIPTTWENRYNDLATMVLGGESPDMFSACDLDLFPGKVAAGMFDPLDDYLDFDSDEWSEGAKKINEMHTINGKHYVACASTSTGLVMIYNKRVIEENGLDDPAELAYNNEWTWDTFKEMCYEFADRNEEKYAVDGWWYEPAMILSTGVPTIGMEDGVITNNLMNNDYARVQEFFLEMKQADVMYPYAEYNWTVQPNRISEGKTLFYPIGRWGLLEPDLSAYGEQDEIMFVPTPRDEKADAWYLTAHGGVDAYAMCKDAPNPEAVAAYIKCLLVQNNDESVQAVNEEQLREQYHWTDEMIEMDKYITELTNANPVIDFYSAVNNDVTSLLSNSIKDASYNGVDWSTTRETLNGAVQTYVDEMNATLAELG